MAISVGVEDREGSAPPNQMKWILHEKKGLGAKSGGANGQQVCPSPLVGDASASEMGSTLWTSRKVRVDPGWGEWQNGGPSKSCP